MRVEYIYYININMADEIKLQNPELTMLINNKEDGYNYRERRQEDWLENYTLYRDKVIINRLEQRQTVNIPLMKTQLRSLIKDVDDIPVLYFENLDNDKDAEIFQNEYWKYTVECNKLDLQDIVDKRQVFHFGRSFDQWQIVDGKMKVTMEDPQDILISRFIDPVNLNSSRFLIHTHIFKPLSVIENDDRYDKAAIAELKKYYATQQGLMKLADNQQMLVEKNKKMAEMGVPDLESPILGETYVELCQHFVFRDNEKDKDGNLMESQIFLYVEADSQQILLKKPLEEVIGVTSDHWWRNHYPYHSWADDLDRQDFWTDGIADIIRTPNKILNAWFSQMVENRTLRNFGMNFFDSNMENFNPGTWEPIPFGTYGVPVPAGKSIRDVLQRVDIPDLSESLDEMTFLINMVEKATGATSSQQGAVEQRQVTLGEVQLALGEAKERIKGMAKFYIPVWKERGQTFLKLIEAAGDKLDSVKIYKKGKNTSEVYSQEITVDDWKTKSGYSVKVWSQEDKNTADTNALQKLNAVKTFMPNNTKLDGIYKRKLLNFADLSPDDINDVMTEEEEKLNAMDQFDPNNPMANNPANPNNPAMPPVQNQMINNRPTNQPVV